MRSCAGCTPAPETAWSSSPRRNRDRRRRRDRLAAGATLLQAYTAFIYQGPFWPRRIHADLVKRKSEAYDSPEA